MTLPKKRWGAQMIPAINGHREPRWFWTRRGAEEFIRKMNRQLPAYQGRYRLVQR